MFLSSRWGKPSFEIEQLPASEFLKQKRFWEVSPWGLCDDVVAQFAAWYMQSKTSDRIDPLKVKKIALFAGTAKKFVIESTKTLRAAFMGIAAAIKGTNK